MRICSASWGERKLARSTASIRLSTATQLDTSLALVAAVSDSDSEPIAMEGIKASTDLETRKGMKIMPQQVATADASLALGFAGYQGGSRPAKILTMYTRASSKDRSVRTWSAGFSKEKMTVADTTTVPRSARSTATICWPRGILPFFPLPSCGSASRRSRRKRPICSTSAVLSSGGPPISLAGMQSTGRQLARSRAPFPLKSHDISQSFVQKRRANFTKKETLMMSSSMFRW
mmetsp:Transcript_18901/g.56672  ORF Transcript_18901/g.56672 Transcript_18901/m.56672 type:complete len:233 (-) Transcript_18901:374-1072(-)